MSQQDLNRRSQKKVKAFYRLRKRQNNRELTKQNNNQEGQTLSNSHNNGFGIIRPTAGDLPANLAESSADQKTGGTPKVLLIIILLALIFITIITYFVHQMPKKD